MNILIIDNGQPFDLETPYVQPLGGSETSVLLLAKGLAELGHSIVLLTSTTVNIPQHIDNLVLHNINRWQDVYEQSQMVIFNRFIIPEIILARDGKLKYYYSHDAYDQTHIVSVISHREIYNRLNKILCVSEWQKQTFIKYLGIPENKLSVIGNSMDPFLYMGYTERNENKLIFASIPYKGINVLADLFNDVCIKSQNEDLELHVYSSMSLYGEQSDKEYEGDFDKLSKTKGVFLHKPISMREMAYQLASSSLYIHPATYHETFGMMFTMAQAAGCLPVTVDNGAANEIIDNKNTGFITERRSILNNNGYQEFVDLVVSLLDEDLYSCRLKAKEASKRWFYLNTAKRFLNSYKG